MTQHAATVGYRRVSKEEQAVEWKTSLDHQTRAITARAEKLGRHLSAEMIFEDRFSGGTSEDRPGFMALVNYCRVHPQGRGTPGYAIFLNDSRFGRFDDPDEAAYWRFVLAKNGWIVRFAEGDDTEDLMARHVLRAVWGSQASQYRHQLQYNSAKGARGTAEKGLWQTRAPYGYRRLATAPGRDPVVLEHGVRKSRDQQVRLTPGPESEVECVRWLFESYASGVESLGSLARAFRLRAQRFKSSKQAVQRMLRNRVYLGEVIWCRRPHDKMTRKETPVRPKSDWVITPNAHAALVTEELFERVQQRLARNQKATRLTQGGYPLSGIIRCGQCGEHYVGGGGRVGPPEDPDRYRFYKCSSDQEGKAICPGPMGTVYKRWVEPVVIGAVADIIDSPAVWGLIEEEIDRVLAEADSTVATERRTLEERKSKLEAEWNNLIGAIKRGILTDTDIAREIKQNRADIEQINGRIAQCELTRSRRDELRAERQRLVALARDFRDQAERISGPRLRELLIPWIETAVLDKVERTLTLVVRQVPRAGLLLVHESGPSAASESLHEIRTIRMPPRPGKQPGPWDTAA